MRGRREGAQGGTEGGRQAEENAIPWFCCCWVPLWI